jgi:hypothetical protein
MTGRQLALLAAVLGALLLLWGGASLTRRGSFGKSESDRFIIPAVGKNEVDTVIIARPSDTTRLARRDSTRWTVNGNPAAASAIHDLFAALADTVRETELVAARPGSHAGLGVDSAKGTRVRLVRGDSALADLVVGNRSPDLDGGYFRAPTDSSVYLVRGSLAEVLSKSSDEWRDRRIAGVMADSVARIEVSRGRGSYSVRRDGTGWKLGPAKADSAAMAGLLDAYRQVEAAGFASPAQADSARFARPDRRATLLRADGSRLLNLAFDSTATGFWARAGDGGTVYRMDSWGVDQLTPPDSTLRAKKQ